ncbi:nucleophile aminohydrolase, partial [Multifurca ochricompacta]
MLCYTICYCHPLFHASMGQEQGTTPSAHTSTVPFYVVAIHGGAGFHPPPSESIKRSLREAIFSASTALSSAASTTARRSSYTPDTDPSALYTVTTLIAALEDAPDFNAGYGSNLTFDGNVECDAALMDGGCRRAGNDSGDGTFDAFGGVGAVEAYAILLGLGRIPPLLLVGEGAVQFAREQGGMNIVDPGEMVAPKAWQEWRVWRERWEDEQRVVAGRSSSGTSELVASAHDLRGGFVSDSNPWKLRGYDEPLSEDKNAELMRLRQDTVGAVVLMGDTGDVAAGVSSGGLLLKPSGRVGEVSSRNSLAVLTLIKGFRRPYLAPAVGRSNYLVVVASLAVSQVRENSSCSRPWQKLSPRRSPQLLTVTRTISSDPY